MKQVFYCTPAVLLSLLFVTQTAFPHEGEAVTVFSLAALCLVIAAAVLLCKGKWWGAFFGMAYGLGLFVYDLIRPGVWFRQWILGLAVLVYFAICAVVAFRSRRSD